MEIIKVETYANIGEIAQGCLSPGQAFLFSNLLSTEFYTTTFLENDWQLHVNLGEKASEVCKLFLEYLRNSGKNTGQKPFRIWQNSNIPKGKGLSSSSADVLGVLVGLNQHFNSSFTVEELYKLASRADPTDACLSSPLTVICQDSGKILSTHNPLQYSIIYFDADPDGSVDTIVFKSKKMLSRGDYLFYNQLYNKLNFAISQANYTDFLFWTTQSAVYNQRFLPKPGFNKLLSFAMDNKLGVFVAHSGTFMGLVVPGVVTDVLYKKAAYFIYNHWNKEIFTETNIQTKFLVNA